MTVQAHAASQELLVSIVVIGRNEGERLRRCLKSIAQMERTGFAVETIYVDSGSADNSLELAARLGARTVALNPEHPSAALGRNAGWRTANGSIVLFLDGDTVLAPGFVRNALRAFDRPEIAVVWGHRRELHPETSIYNRVLDLDWIYLPGPTPFCGGDALFRRRVLDQTEGFDPSLIAGEEPELCRRISGLGHTILHVDLLMTGHDLAMMHWSQYWKRSTRAGHAYAEVSERFHQTSAPFWSAEASHNRRRASMLLGIVALATLLSIVFWSWLPLPLGILFLLGLAVRTAWKARWKTDDWLALLLYGIHSHLQQIPILVGQMQYWNNQRQGLHSRLVEYK